ncbi:MAG: hypothetical protein OXH63_16180 [Gemmatimonadetes bacterium]|nr:hypothetical protein [Gemmatimonadota bacterium]
MTSEKKHLFDQPRNVRRLIWIFFALCILLLGADLLFHRHLNFAEGVFPVEGWFGFYAIYGFVACVLLVLTATQMRKVLMRREDYYD